LPDVVSHVIPQPVQLLIVFNGWQRPVQHPLPAGHPCEASHPVTQLLFEHVWPRGQLESTRQATQVWFVVSQVVPPPVPPPPPSVAASPDASLVPASASAAQSTFDLQPGAHTDPAQYWPVGQLSLDGRHWTQVSFVVSHQGVAPWHCELTVHSTHSP
jgi:hypothetical protein